MFTGLIEEMGTVTRFEAAGSGARLEVQGPGVLQGAGLGDSIAVSGVCLTVSELLGDRFAADVMAETLRHTTLGDMRAGARVNLERALPANGRLGGHIVQGHVDGTSRLTARTEGKDWDDFVFELPVALARYAARKGSISIDGVSLTITDVVDAEPGGQVGSFGVSLIPTTLRQTNLGLLLPGDRVNLEMDVIAKYVERLTQ